MAFIKSTNLLQGTPVLLLIATRAPKVACCGATIPAELATSPTVAAVRIYPTGVADKRRVHDMKNWAGGFVVADGDAGAEEQREGKKSEQSPPTCHLSDLPSLHDEDDTRPFCALCLPPDRKLPTRGLNSNDDWPRYSFVSTTARAGARGK